MFSQEKTLPVNSNNQNDFRALGKI